MRDGDDRINLGFIAQDIEALLGADYSVLGIGEHQDRMLSLRYTDFIAPLVKAIQEQQIQIQRLHGKDQEIADLKAQVTEQQSVVKKTLEQNYIFFVRELFRIEDEIKRIINLSPVHLYTSI